MSLLRTVAAGLAGLTPRAFDASGFLDPNRIPSNGELASTWTGIAVNERRALQLTTVFSCVALISETVAQLPVGAFRGTGNDRLQLPDPQLLTEPEPGKTWVDWIGEGLVADLLRGNAYGRVVDRDRLGYPTSIITLHPDECSPRRDRATGAKVFKIAGERDTVPAMDVLHVKGLTLPGAYSLEGLSPIEYARQTIGLALGAEEFGARYFGEGSQPAGILTSDQQLDEATAKEAQARWMATHGGRSRRPAVLGKGLSWQSVSVKPDESQFLATIEAKASTICGFYRVPPHMVGIVSKATSWGTGIEEQTLGFIQFCLGIWLVRWEQALSRMLPRGQYVKFNVAGLLRGRLLDQYRAFLMARQGGWLNVDEIRALLDLKALPDGMGEDYLAPLNYQPVPPGGLPIAEPDAPPAPGLEDDEGEDDDA